MDTNNLKRLFIDERHMIKDSILASEWPTIQQVDWILETRRKLCTNATDGEKNVMYLLDSYDWVYTFQQPFVIEDKIYFTDFFFNPLRLAIEIDGDYHKPSEQKYKDLDREIDLSNYGVRTYRITNIETVNESLLENLITGIANRRCYELFGCFISGIGGEYYEGLTPEQVKSVGGIW